MLYTEERLATAFGVDVIAYGGQAVALVALWRLDALTGTSALLTLAAAFAAGAAAVGWCLRETLSGRFDRGSLAANWRFGKWLGVAEVAQWLSTQFYVYLGAAIVGSVASAALKAAQTLLGPMSVFLTFVTSRLPTVLAHERESTGTLLPGARRSLVRILPVVGVYCAVVALLARPALEAVYGEAYGGYADVVRLFAVYYVLLAFSTVAIAALSAADRTRDVFVGQAAGAVVSLAVGWLFLQEWGAAGGVAGMIVSWAAAMALFARSLRRAQG
jgi:O-antigen/teichoic acid export membrane protein